MNNYIKYMALHNFSSSYCSVISTNSMLQKITSAVPSYTSVIATTYIGRDIIGQLGGLLYAWRLKNKNPKKSVIAAVLLQNSSYFLENSSPIISSDNFVLPFLGFTNMMKNISFISIGSVNAMNLQKLAESENKNIGELYAKIASINTISSSLGMFMGILTLNFVPSYTVRTFVFMPILTLVSLYAVRKALES